MKNSKQNISIYVIYCCIFLLLSSCKSGGFLQKTLGIQHYRIAKELTYYDYDCMGSESIDFDARLEFEKIYTYNNGNQLVSVKTHKFDFEQVGSYEYSSDSIVYLNRDSVLIIWKTDRRLRKDDKQYGSFSLKTKDFFNSNYFRSIGVDNNQIIDCNNFCRVIEHSKRHYEIVCIWNTVFVAREQFFLNDKGYVVKKMLEDDKSCITVTIYEYELGYNPYQLYYTFSVAE